MTIDNDVAKQFDPSSPTKKGPSGPSERQIQVPPEYEAEFNQPLYGQSVADAVARDLAKTTWEYVRASTLGEEHAKQYDDDPDRARREQKYIDEIAKTDKGKRIFGQAPAIKSPRRFGVNQKVRYIKGERKRLLKEQKYTVRDDAGYKREVNIREMDLGANIYDNFKTSYMKYNVREDDTPKILSKAQDKLFRRTAKTIAKEIRDDPNGARILSSIYSGQAFVGDVLVAGAAAISSFGLWNWMLGWVDSSKGHLREEIQDVKDTFDAIHNFGARMGIPTTVDAKKYILKQIYDVDVDADTANYLMSIDRPGVGYFSKVGALMGEALGINIVYGVAKRMVLRTGKKKFEKWLRNNEAMLIKEGILTPKSAGPSTKSWLGIKPAAPKKMDEIRDSDWHIVADMYLKAAKKFKFDYEKIFSPSLIGKTTQRILTSPLTIPLQVITKTRGTTFFRRQNLKGIMLREGIKEQKALATGATRRSAKERGDYEVRADEYSTGIGKLDIANAISIKKMQANRLYARQNKARDAGNSDQVARLQNEIDKLHVENTLLGFGVVGPTTREIVLSELLFSTGTAAANHYGNKEYDFVFGLAAAVIGPSGIKYSYHGMERLARRAIETADDIAPFLLKKMHKFDKERLFAGKDEAFYTYKTVETVNPNTGVVTQKRVKTTDFEKGTIKKFVSVLRAANQGDVVLNHIDRAHRLMDEIEGIGGDTKNLENLLNKLISISPIIAFQQVKRTGASNLTNAFGGLKRDNLLTAINDAARDNSALRELKNLLDNLLPKTRKTKDGTDIEISEDLTNFMKGIDLLVSNQRAVLDGKINALNGAVTDITTKYRMLDTGDAQKVDSALTEIKALQRELENLNKKLESEGHILEDTQKTLTEAETAKKTIDKTSDDIARASDELFTDTLLPISARTHAIDDPIESLLEQGMLLYRTSLENFRKKYDDFFNNIKRETPEDDHLIEADPFSYAIYRLLRSEFSPADEAATVSGAKISKRLAKDLANKTIDDVYLNQLKAVITKQARFHINNLGLTKQELKALEVEYAKAAGLSKSDTVDDFLFLHWLKELESVKPGHFDANVSNKIDRASIKFDFETVVDLRQAINEKLATVTAKEAPLEQQAQYKNLLDSLDELVRARLSPAQLDEWTNLNRSYADDHINRFFYTEIGQLLGSHKGRFHIRKKVGETGKNDEKLKIPNHESEAWKKFFDIEKIYRTNDAEIFMDHIYRFYGTRDPAAARRTVSDISEVETQSAKEFDFRDSEVKTAVSDALTSLNSIHLKRWLAKGHKRVPVKPTTDQPLGRPPIGRMLQDTRTVAEDMTGVGRIVPTQGVRGIETTTGANPSALIRFDETNLISRLDETADKTQQLNRAFETLNTSIKKLEKSMQPEIKRLFELENTMHNKGLYSLFHQNIKNSDDFFNKVIEAPDNVYLTKDFERQLEIIAEHANKVSKDKQYTPEDVRNVFKFIINKNLNERAFGGEIAEITQKVSREEKVLPSGSRTGPRARFSDFRKREKEAQELFEAGTIIRNFDSDGLLGDFEKMRDRFKIVWGEEAAGEIDRIEDILKIVHQMNMEVFAPSGLGIHSTKGLGPSSWISRIYAMDRGVVSPRYVFTEAAFILFRRKRGDDLQALMQNPELADMIYQILARRKPVIGFRNNSLIKGLMRSLAFGQNQDRYEDYPRRIPGTDVELPTRMRTFTYDEDAITMPKKRILPQRRN